MLRRLLLSFLPLLVLVSSPSLRAQVTASLVSADTSVQPGHPFTVALKLSHQPHWHTYWINAGTGYATSLEWKLPAGWSAGPIQWPTPKVLRDEEGNIIGHGYENEVLLPVIITPPASISTGQTVSLDAKASWLMCKDTCVPGEAQVSLNLPVSDTPAASTPDDKAAMDYAYASLPREVPGWQVKVARDGDHVIVRLTRSENLGRFTPKAPWVFAEQDLIQYDAPQKFEKVDDNSWVFDLKISPYASETDVLTGVIRSENGWTPSDHGPKGLSYSAPIETVTTPSSDVEIKVQHATPEAAVATRSFGGTVALAFIGGLILNLMPCVFPVLGIKILGFVNQAGSDRRKVTLHGIAFAVGVLLSFWTLAGVLAVLRSGGSQLGWGFQLQDPHFVLLMAALLLVFALSMSGVFEFGLSATAVGGNLQNHGGYRGSFFTGVLATVVATPCSAPFLAPALGAALALPVAQSFLLFTAIAVGLSTPYLLLSIFPDAIKLLPRPGAWMETFKQFMAFPLYGTVGYLVWVMAGQVNDQGLLYVLLGLTLVSMAVWLYGRYAPPHASNTSKRFGVIGGLVLFALGIGLGWPRAASPTDITWEPWSQEKVDALRKEGRPVYVDFTARWCFTCQTNKKVVFHSDDVLKAFSKLNVATLRGDWTNKDPKITEELARWNRAAVPFNLIYLPGKEAPVVLPELLTPSIVLEALASGSK